MFNGKFKVFASVEGPKNYTEQNNSVYSILLTRRFFIAGLLGYKSDCSELLIYNCIQGYFHPR